MPWVVDPSVVDPSVPPGDEEDEEEGTEGPVTSVGRTIGVPAQQNNKYILTMGLKMSKLLV